MIFICYNNVDIVFALDGIDTRNPDYEFKLAMISAIAQEESRKTSERVKWGQARRMEQGVDYVQIAVELIGSPLR